MRFDLNKRISEVGNYKILEHVLVCMQSEKTPIDDEIDIDCTLVLLSNWLSNQGIPARYIVALQDDGTQLNLFEIDENENLTMLLLKEPYGIET